MTERHESSCSVYNAPAYEPGPCDCKYRELNESIARATDLVELAGEDPALRKLLDRYIDKAVEAIRMSDQ